MTSRLIVVKVGTSSITTGDGKLNGEEMHRLVNQIAAAIKQGDKIVLVTSGAVAAGIAELDVPQNPTTLSSSKHQRQQGKACSWPSTVNSSKSTD